MEEMKDTKDITDAIWAFTSACNVMKKYYASQLPKDCYKIVFKVKQINLKNQDNLAWKFCILGYNNECVVQSPDGFPGWGTKFFDPEYSKHEKYIMYVVICESLEEAERIRLNYIERTDNFLDLIEKKIDQTQVLEPSPYLEVKKHKSKQDIKLEQAQSLAAKNANRITVLENELRELRELQVFLKKARIPE